MDRESEALVREITEALKAARSQAAKQRLGNDLKKAVNEAKKWSELDRFRRRLFPASHGTKKGSL